MKKNLVLLTIAFALCFSQGSRAQTLTTTDVPRILSYQGHITNADQAVTGVHPITIRLYTDPEGKHKLWEDTYTTDVKDGIFSVLLGSQTVLPSTERLDKPIWLGVSISGTDEMRPLTQFTTAPYALNVPDKSITKEKLSEDLQTLMTKPIGGQEKQVSPDWTNAGDPYGCSGEVLGTNTSGCDLVLVTYGSQVMRYKYNATSNNILGGYSGNTIGNGAGNIIAGGGESGQINAIAANASTDYGVISGGFGNDLDGGASFIGGGEDNSLVAEWAFIGGGYSNDLSGGTNGSNYSAILGGYNNDITGQYSAIVGGKDLAITGDNVLGFNGGGSGITFTGNQAFYLNDVDAHLDNNDDAARKLIFYEPSGSGNNVTTIKAQAQSADINYILPSTIGTLNQVLSLVGVAGSTGTLGWADGGAATCWKLAGNAGLTAGTDNFLGTTSAVPIQIITNNVERARVLSTGEVGIGTSTPSTLTHLLLTNSTTNAINNVLTIGHNSTGTAANGLGSGISFQLESTTTNNKDAAHVKVSWVDATDATLTGAYEIFLAGRTGTLQTASTYRVWRAEHTTDAPNIIGGEDGNFVTSLAVGSTVAGGGTAGAPNGVTDNFGVVGGGKGNQAGNASGGVLDAEFATIAGGLDNTASGEESFIGGGSVNTASGVRAAVAGGVLNDVSGSQSFVGGGSTNVITEDDATISGGANNAIDEEGGAIGGGRENTINLGAENSAILGGRSNDISASKASIGGGDNNTVTSAAEGGTIPGGINLQSQSFVQTVIGVNNKLQGSANSSNFRSANANDRIFIIGNGTSTDTKENAYEVSNNGHSIVYHNNTNNTNPAIKGARYIDNTTVAWGHVLADGTLHKGFACTSIWTYPNVYTITINYTDPYTGAIVPINNGAEVTATLIDNGTLGEPHCGHITVTPVQYNSVPNTNTFQVRTFSDRNPCASGVRDFMFRVVCRP